MSKLFNAERLESDSLPKREAIPLSKRAFYRASSSETWNLIWEAGPYYENVVTALEKARNYAVFVGWQLDSRLELTTKRKETFKQFVVRLCVEQPNLHFYFLIWDYSYFYLFEREIMQSWVWDNIHERVHFIFDNRHPYGGSHHEKCVIIDGEIAFVGGVDICDERWDSPQHNFEDIRRSLHHVSEEHLPYHDLSVEVRGEVAADLVEYIGERWRILSTVPFPERPRVARSEGFGQYKVLISRTRVQVDSKKPSLVRETEFLYRELIRSVERQLIIENQYYWSPTINDELILLMKRRARTGLKIFIIIPSADQGRLVFRLMGGFQKKLLERLSQVACETETILVCGCPYSRKDQIASLGKNESITDKSIYVHSKLMIVDDRYMSVGSANFNYRGFRFDTELTLTLVADSISSRKCLADYGQKIIRHWGINTTKILTLNRILPEFYSLQKNVYLKPYADSWASYFKSIEGKIANRFLFDWLFDPKISQTYFLKRRILAGSSHQRSRAVPWLIWGATMCSLGLALVLISILVKLVEIKFVSLVPILFFSALLSSSWMFPFPVTAISAFAGYYLKSQQGAVVVVSATFVSLVLGYCFSRMFPNLANEFYLKSISSKVMKTLGLRQFSINLKLMMSPRLSFYSKSAFQGVFSIPLRWFLPTAILQALFQGAVAYGFGQY